MSFPNWSWLPTQTFTFLAFRSGKLGLRMPDAASEWFHGALITMVGLRTDATLANENDWDWVLEKPPQVCDAEQHAKQLM